MHYDRTTGFNGLITGFETSTDDARILNGCDASRRVLPEAVQRADANDQHEEQTFHRNAFMCNLAYFVTAITHIRDHDQ